MKNEHKIGLVVEGGGMKCAYNAGILDDADYENALPNITINVV